MSAIVVPVCRCGLQMRLSPVRDACECRCGLWVDAETIIMAPGAPLPDTAFQQGEPHAEREPGIVLSNIFADIVGDGWDAALIEADKVPEEAALQRACANAFECSGLRYAGAPTTWARGLVVDGETLERRRFYALAPVDKVAVAIRDMVQGLLLMHGPGRLWAHGKTPVEPFRNGDVLRGAVIAGVPHIILRCYYFHRPVEPKVEPAP
jgi:hypothetical protein